VFGRVFSPDLKQDLESQLINVNYFDLFASFKDMLARSKVQRFHEVVREEVSLGQKINELLDDIAERGEISFFEFITRQPSIMAKVVSFLAILELVKIRSIRIAQSGLFGDIRVSKNIDASLTEPEQSVPSEGIQQT
jgi:segregation and condensation protein A